MATRYLGPSARLTLADGQTIEKGGTLTIDDATRAALEQRGHRFRDDAAGAGEAGPAEHAPQSAAENLAQQGKTAESAAADAGLSAGVGQEVPPQQQPTTAPARAPRSS